LNLSEALNSDLSTLLAEARRGFDWWTDELAALVPSFFRTWRTDQSNMVFWDGKQAIMTADGTRVDGSQGMRSRTVVLPRTMALIRDMTGPAMTRSDLEKMLTLNSERYFPMPKGSVLFASAIRPQRNDDGTMQTDLAAVPVVRLAEMVSALQHAAITPSAPELRFNFLPAMRGAGLIDNARDGSRMWWMLVGLLLALNLAMLVWRDAAEVARLQSLADAQRPAVAVAKRMVARMRTIDALARRDASRGLALDEPLSVLAAVTTAMPDGAWVQRYVWDGKSLQLTGYRARGADVASAIRQIQGFTNVKSAQTDSIAETATGQAFDLIAEIRGR
jgi:Fimbrial assembly protein (PilN)